MGESEHTLERRDFIQQLVTGGMGKPRGLNQSGSLSVSSINIKKEKKKKKINKNISIKEREKEREREILMSPVLQEETEHFQRSSSFVTQELAVGEAPRSVNISVSS